MTSVESVTQLPRQPTRKEQCRAHDVSRSRSNRISNRGYLPDAAQPVDGHAGAAGRATMSLIRLGLVPAA